MESCSNITKLYVSAIENNSILEKDKTYLESCSKLYMPSKVY